MSKVAAYLRGHLSGEVATREDIRSAYANDRGVLSLRPEMVIYPRTTNDIRKVARFAWQLAEKGHVLPITVRGGGYDSTGAAIGKGALLVMPAHLNRVFEYDSKQKLVRLQPGVTVGALSESLRLHGARISALEGLSPLATIGGAVASNLGGAYAGKYGTIARSVSELEVVLANGDVIMTKRINKKELNRRKGLQTFEGDIYRGIDGIIEEYGEVLDAISEDDVLAYSTIADVKKRDGSFDLTPLFVGSQGTLGIISEMIMKAEFVSAKRTAAALVFESAETARDALDFLAALNPALLEYFDAELFTNAATAGHTYEFYQEASGKFNPAAVVLVEFDEFNARARAKHLKKISKKYEKTEGVTLQTAEDAAVDDLLAATEVVHHTAYPDHVDQTIPPLYTGFSISAGRLEEFANGLKELALREHVELPLAGHAITGVYGVYPTLSLKKVSDKQKIFKLLDEITKLIVQNGGTMVAEGGEGRLKARPVYANLDDKTREMYEAVRNVCDPQRTLNPGVKQISEVRTIASMLRNDVDAGRGF